MTPLMRPVELERCPEHVSPDTAGLRPREQTVCELFTRLDNKMRGWKDFIIEPCSN